MGKIAPKPVVPTVHRGSSHHYPSLIARWKAVAATAGLRFRTLVRDSGFTLHYLQTPALKSDGGIYLSAGIHGDEPAGTEALLAWAESLGESLRTLPLLIFPCLNPWGLTHNMRFNREGNDLNRQFHLDSPVISAVKRVVGDRQFGTTVHLHEDFDANGMYLYELTRGEGWGEELLDVAAEHLKPDTRSRIDRRLASGGLIRRQVTEGTFKRIGYPEAIWLYFGHTDRTYTIETPSEAALEVRIAAQVAVVKSIVERSLA